MTSLSGFTIIRNGVEFDYPFIESLNSMLPVVDELLVLYDCGTDNTLERLKLWKAQANQLFPTCNIRLEEKRWPLDEPGMKESGKILSIMTNEALSRCRFDWCFYLQADEVIHEDDVPLLLRLKSELSSKYKSAEGCVFKYIHFYGAYNVIQETRRVYRREVRIVRRSSGAISVGDAQSFRKPDQSKLNCILIDASIYHYGWARPQEAMHEKTFFMDQLYHGEATELELREKKPKTGTNYQYRKRWGLYFFKGTHPHIMKERIDKAGWFWDLSLSKLDVQWSDLRRMTLDAIEKLIGYRLFEYKPYKIKWKFD